MEIPHNVDVEPSPIRHDQNALYFLFAEVFRLSSSSESKHLGLFRLLVLFQLAGQLKQYAPDLPFSAAHKTLAFCLKQEDFPNPPVPSAHKKRPEGPRPSQGSGLRRRVGNTKIKPSFFSAIVLLAQVHTAWLLKTHILFGVSYTPSQSRILICAW